MTPTTSPRLTEQQQAIVDHDSGPALVFAVAGAGKTTAMVRRIERLARARVFAPDRILATSFSRATVQDIRGALSPWSHCAQVHLLTLHALGYRVIRQAQQRRYLGKVDFDTADTSDLSRHILYQTLAVARSRNVPYKDELEGLDLEDFLNYVGACKGNLRYAHLDRAQLPAFARTVATPAAAPPGMAWYLDLYRLFEDVRQRQGQITFDDMLMTGWELLVRHPDLLDATRTQYECVLVDEFQDVNLAQSEILDLITDPHRNYMAIGDDDQTIYEWRGANPGFILNFRERYDAQTYVIDENFRCKASQLVLANKVIEHNQKRQPKRLGLTQGFDGYTRVSLAESPEQLARNLVSEIQAALYAGMQPAAVAVLVRLYAQTPYIEQCLTTAGIPYRIVGSVPFYRRPEVVTLVNYLHLGLLERELCAGTAITAEQMTNCANAWRNVYNRPKRYLAREWSERVWEAVTMQQKPLSQVLQATSADVQPGYIVKNVANLAQDLTWLASILDAQPAEQALHELDLRLGYRAYLQRNSGFAETGEGNAAGVTAFIDYARDKGTVIALMQHLHALESSAYGNDTGSPSNTVTLTTIFRSKGLEWPLVFIPNCNQGTFPFGESERIEEERRLLYVAITRSKQYLHVHCLKHVPISPFLREAEYRQTLDAVGAMQSSLARDPQVWGKQDALAIAVYPPRYHLERYFSRWWNAPPTTKAHIIQAVQRLLASAERHPGDTPDGQPDLIELWRMQHAPDPPVPPPAGQAHRSAPTGSALSQPLRRGDRVRHATFGVGIVQQVAGPPHDPVVTVRFERCGTRQLAAKLARLERV